MQVECIVVGNLKEQYWKDASKEYEKRLQRFCKFSITELKEIQLPDKASSAIITQTLDKEAALIMKKIDPRDHVVVLAIKGKTFTSEAFAQQFEQFSFLGKKIVFIIGSSHGLSDMIYERAQQSVSFSSMTFPHQFARIMLIEQIYRAFKINGNEAYHK